MEIERRVYTVSGFVQRVGFRMFVRDSAERIGVYGWVRNHPDGRTVEAVAEGTSDALDRFEARLRAGPPGARVERVHVEHAPPTGEFTAFAIRR